MKILRYLLPIILLSIFFVGQAFANYITVDNVKYWTQISGKGKPVIVLLSDSGQQFDDWQVMIKQLSNVGTVFAYDRAGVGKSEQLMDELSPRDAKSIATRLQAVLKASDLQGPYIFVSYGLGSSYARYYARNFPKQTKGILLINPAVNAKIAYGNLSNFGAGEKAEQAKFRKTYNTNLHNLRVLLHELHRNVGRSGHNKKSKMLLTTRLELLGEPVSEKQIESSPKLQIIPVVVLDGKRVSSLSMQAGEDIATESKQGKYISESVKAQKLSDMPVAVIEKIIKQMTT